MNQYSEKGYYHTAELDNLFPEIIHWNGKGSYAEADRFLAGAKGPFKTWREAKEAAYEFYKSMAEEMKTAIRNLRDLRKPAK